MEATEIITKTREEVENYLLLKIRQLQQENEFFKEENITLKAELKHLKRKIYKINSIKGESKYIDWSKKGVKNDR